MFKNDLGLNQLYRLMFRYRCGLIGVYMFGYKFNGAIIRHMFSSSVEMFVYSFFSFLPGLHSSMFR